MYMEKSYQTEGENREKRLSVYSERIQEYTLSQSKQIIGELVEERHRQNMTQQEIADITGIRPSNLARVEGGSRVPTLVVLQKYGKRQILMRSDTKLPQHFASWSNSL